MVKEEDNRHATEETKQLIEKALASLVNQNVHLVQRDSHESQCELQGILDATSL